MHTFKSTYRRLVAETGGEPPKVWEMLSNYYTNFETMAEWLLREAYFENSRFKNMARLEAQCQVQSGIDEAGMLPALDEEFSPDYTPDEHDVGRQGNFELSSKRFGEAATASDLYTAEKEPAIEAKSEQDGDTIMKAEGEAETVGPVSDGTPTKAKTNAINA